MKLIQMSTLAILGLTFLGGCGDTTAANENEITNSIKPHQLNKEMRLNSNQEDIGLNVKISNDSTDYIFEYSSSTKHIQIYLNTDKTETSGYRRWGGIGAEYLIEDHYMFKYVGGADGMDWNWEYLGEVSEITGDYYAKLAFDTFGQDVNSFTVQAIAVNENWHNVFTSNETVMTRVVDYKRYRKVLGYSSGIQDNRPQAIISQDNLNYYLLYYRDEFDMAHTQFFVDIDTNSATGYEVSNSTDEKLGAEYLIEDNMLFKYIGSDGATTWQWERVGQLHTFNGHLNKVVIALPKKEVSDWNTECKIVNIALNESWNFLYSSKMVTYKSIHIDNIIKDAYDRAMEAYRASDNYTLPNYRRLTDRNLIISSNNKYVAIDGSKNLAVFAVENPENSFRLIHPYTENEVATDIVFTSDTEIKYTGNGRGWVNHYRYNFLTDELIEE